MKVLLALAAIVGFVLAVMYWAGSLQFGASHPGPHHLHAVLFAVLGILALVAMRFAGARRT